MLEELKVPYEVKLWEVGFHKYTTEARIKLTTCYSFQT